MKKIVLLAVSVLGLVCMPYTFFPDRPDWFKLDASWAAQGGEGSNTSCNGQGNPNSPCQGGQGGAGGAGGNGGQGGQGGSSAAASTSSASSTGGVGIGGNAGASASYEGYQTTSVNIEGTRFDRYAPSVAAPALTAAGTGVCLGSVSIGLSGPMAGASFGITKVDKGCERRSGAALLYQMGYKDAAIRLLSNDPEIKEALSGPVAPVKAAEAHQAAALTIPAAMAATQARQVEGVQGN